MSGTLPGTAGRRFNQREKTRVLVCAVVFWFLTSLCVEFTHDMS